jgi:hypothetical protein
MKHLGCGLLVLVGLAACGSGSGSAVAVCRRAETGTFVNAQRTSVGEVRQLVIGLDARPLAKAFPRAKATAFAAWCWDQTGPDSFTSYVVGPDGTKVVVGTTSGSHTKPAPGAPAFP